MVLVRARIALQKISWRKEPNVGEISSAVVRSYANHSPWEQEHSAWDYCLALERQERAAAVYHQETRHCSGSQLRWRYSRRTFGSNTTNSVASKTPKSQA